KQSFNACRIGGWIQAGERSPDERSDIRGHAPPHGPNVAALMRATGRRMLSDKIPVETGAALHNWARQRTATERDRRPANNRRPADHEQRLSGEPRWKRPPGGAFAPVRARPQRGRL